MAPSASDTTDIEDVDDVVGIAAELMRNDAEVLDRQALEEVGAELDIPPEYMARAREELARRRQVAEQEKRETKARSKKLVVGLGVSLISLVLVLGAAYAVIVPDLRQKKARAAEHAAQVDNVRARQRAIQATLGSQPSTPDREAELVGAENRVRVEAQRYAKAAAEYNEAASGLLAPILASWAGLPRELPLTPPPTLGPEG